MILKDSAKVGEPLAKYLKVDDIVLEIDNKSLSNRPDLLNHYGISRELSAIFNLPLRPYEKNLNRVWNFLSSKENKLEVKILAPDLCLRYMAVSVSNIEIKESPTWLKEKLVAANQRPINNIVDLTNYVMFDCGQPMHAFDASKIKKIVVRRAEKDEVIETLDEKPRLLSADDLVITDGKQAVALAGVMGGHNSEISSDTKELILESANFLAASVRKTSQKIGLRTESSVRFEKSLDPNICEAALARCFELIRETSPDAKIDSQITDSKKFSLKTGPIDLDLNWVAKRLGEDLGKEKIVKILSALGFGIEDGDNQVLKIMIPTWRATKDVSAKEDLVEEILRIYGYDNIESRLPIETLNLPEINQERLLERKIKNILALKQNLFEIYNYSFVGEDQLKKLNIDFFNYLKLANPMSEIQSMLRQSLVPGLVNNIKSNQFKADSLGLFEFGNVFFNAPGSLKKETNNDETLPYQEKHLGLALAADDKNIFERLKGMINNLMQNLLNFGLETEFLLSEEVPGWADKKVAAKINIIGKEIGIVAILNKEASDNVNLKKPVVIAEINFTALADLILSAPTICFKEMAKYPAVVRDLAFVLNEKILYNEIKGEIIKFNPLIKELELFDIYSGSKLAGDEKSLAFHLTFQSDDKTLTTDEVDSVVADLIKHLGEKFEARLRD